MTPLKYYFVKKNEVEFVIFNKYSFDDGIIVNKTTGYRMTYSKSKAGYNRCTVKDNDGNPRAINIARAIASTFHGSPPTSQHTADHVDKNRGNDTIENIRWATKQDQNINQERPLAYKSSLIITNNGIEKTANEWVEHFKGQKNHLGREYSGKMIRDYARQKKHDFSYKEFPDLPGEIWKEIPGSKNTTNHWEISNMNRVKYVATDVYNVISDERLGLSGNGYPTVNINRKQWLCHILTFMTFFPDEWNAKNTDEVIKHVGDNKLDFRPHKLHLGTQSENMLESYVNGKRNDAKSARVRCASYINDVLEKVHESQGAAEKYLKLIGYEKAAQSNISLSLSGHRTTAYDRSWKYVQ